MAAVTLVALGLARFAAADAILVNDVPTASVCCLDGSSPSSIGPFAIAGNFVFEGPTGTLLRTVGAYLQRNGEGNPDAGTLSPGTGTPFGFEVLDDQTVRSCLPPPDDDVCSFVFKTSPSAATGDASHFPGDDYLPSRTLSLTLVTATLDVPVPLVSGNRYWILLSTFFLPSQGAYWIGGRSGTGTFAASFDPNLTEFFGAADLANLGTDIDPMFDLAIYASGTEPPLQPVPEPATIALFAVGMLLIVAQRRKIQEKVQSPA